MTNADRKIARKFLAARLRRASDARLRALASGGAMWDIAAAEMLASCEHGESLKAAANAAVALVRPLVAATAAPVAHEALTDAERIFARV